MASVAIDGNLAFVAAALSALTEKHIVPKQEYDQIKERVRRGEDTGYVCKGEVNVVKEIEQTYAKTAVLVALKYHPELVEQGEIIQLDDKPVLGPETQSEPSATKYPRNAKKQTKKKSFGIARIKSLIYPSRNRKILSRSSSSTLDAHKTQCKYQIVGIDKDRSTMTQVRRSSTSAVDTLTTKSTSPDIATSIDDSWKLKQESASKTPSRVSSNSIVTPTTKRATPDIGTDLEIATAPIRSPIIKGEVSARVSTQAYSRDKFELLERNQESLNSSTSSLMYQSAIDDTNHVLSFADEILYKKQISDRDSRSECEYISGDTPRRKHFRKPKVKPFRHHRGYRELNSSDEDMAAPLNEIEKNESVMGETLSEENVEGFSDDDPLLRRGGTSKKERLKIRSKKNRSSQGHFQTHQSDRDSLDSPQDIYQGVQDIEPLLPEGSDQTKKEAIPDQVMMPLQTETPRNENSLDLLIVLPSGKTIIVTVESRNRTIGQLKDQINLKTGFLKGEQVLHFGANLLRNDAALKDYDIVSNSTIHMSLKIRGGSKKKDIFYLDNTYLAPKFDYDFTNITDDGTEYMRGGHTYHRPYGWKRHAIKVLGKYDNDKWLVNTGKGNGEWAVSYHGTSKNCFNLICEQGYKIGKNNLHGKGVYSSPFIDKALEYSTVFTHKGVEYQGIFQNRVNPKGVNIVKDKKYWVCSNPKDIRPYALCVRKYN